MVCEERWVYSGIEFEIARETLETEDWSSVELDTCVREVVGR